MCLAKVFVILKPTVNEPQRLTILGALHSLEFSSAKSVKAGKYMEIRLEGSDRSEAEAEVEETGQKLLANPIVEDFRFDLEDWFLLNRRGLSPVNRVFALSLKERALAVVSYHPDLEIRFLLPRLPGLPGSWCSTAHEHPEPAPLP